MYDDNTIRSIIYKLQAVLLQWDKSYEPDLIRCRLQAVSKTIESKDIKEAVANSLINELGLSRRVIAYFSNPYQKHLADRLTAEIEKVNYLGNFDARQSNITIYYLPTICEIKSALDDCLAAIPIQQTKLIMNSSGSTAGNKQTEGQESLLEPKPPPILQHILWVCKNFRKHWKLISLAILILLFLPVFKWFLVPQWNKHFEQKDNPAIQAPRIPQAPRRSSVRPNVNPTKELPVKISRPQLHAVNEPNINTTK